MLRRIATELRRHVPFTALGTLTGIIILAMIVFANISGETSETIFYILHPLHVLLSALVTTAIYRRYRKGKIWAVVLIGWTGSIGIATMSDSLIPYAGEVLLRLHPEAHIGFIERWWLVNPLAFAGIALGYWKPTTRIPHAGHVLLSTWASLFHIVMAMGETINWLLLPAIALFLFLAVWLPCCTSDIVYPLLFVREAHKLSLPREAEAVKLEERRD